MYRLPDFLRTAWVSDLARETWKPRFEAIRAAWPHALLKAVAESSLECVIRTLPPWMIFRLQAEASRAGVSVAVLATRGLATPSHLALSAKPATVGQGRPFLYEVAIGAQAACAAVEELWEAQEYTAAYRFTGTPECCVAAMEEDIALHRGDPIWRYTAAGKCVEAEAASMADPLWSWWNIGALSFAPCTPGCCAALSLREQLVDLARQAGYLQEMDWLEAAWTWPAEWTALHGIAELKTPIVKATWSTDVAYTKATLRYLGDGYPDEGATGLGFPYQSPSRPLLTSSQSFQRGIENLIQIRC